MAVFLLEPVVRGGDYLEPIIEQDVELEGRAYSYRLRWVDRVGRWLMDLYDAAGDAIWKGRYVNAGAPVGLGIQDTRKPPGLLILVDGQGKEAEAGFEDLGARHVLTYITSDEIAAVAGANPLAPISIRDPA